MLLALSTALEQICFHLSLYQPGSITLAKFAQIWGHLLLAWGQAAKLQTSGWDLSSQCYTLIVQLRACMDWWGWDVLVTSCLCELRKLLLGFPVFNWGQWYYLRWGYHKGWLLPSMSRSVTHERNVITWASPYATFSWMLTRCLITAEFFLPFSVVVVSSLLLYQLFSLVPT